LIRTLPPTKSWPGNTNGISWTKLDPVRHVS
jgi:hypothetical protein